MGGGGGYNAEGIKSAGEVRRAEGRVWLGGGEVGGVEMWLQL